MKNKCPICNSRLSSKLVSKNSKLTKINCNRCGWHRVDRNVEFGLGELLGDRI